MIAICIAIAIHFNFIKKKDSRVKFLTILTMWFTQVDKSLSNINDTISLKTY